MRRVVLAGAAVVLTVEGLGSLLAALLFSSVFSHYRMSLGGQKIGLLQAVVWVLEGGQALLFLAGALLLLLAVFDHTIRGTVVVVSAAAVVQGIVAALLGAVSGWLSFGVMIVILGLIVFAALCVNEPLPEAVPEPLPDHPNE